MPFGRQFLFFILGALFGGPALAEHTVDLGLDAHGSRWQVTHHHAILEKHPAGSSLFVEFQKPRHFRQHHPIKAVRLNVRLLCDQQDMAIDRVVFHDKSGGEIAHLSGNVPSQAYAQLLPASIKKSLFDNSCAASALAADAHAESPRTGY